MTTPAMATENWSLQRDRDGIKIWTMLEDGNAIESYKAEMILTATIADVEAKIATAEAFASWAPDIRDAQTLADDDLSYIVYAMPFPVKDRDLVQTTQIQRAPKATSIIMTAAPDAIPEKRKLVRVLESRLEWQLEAVSETETKLTSIGYTDPRGVPPIVINLLIVEGPYRTMKALRKAF